MTKMHQRECSRSSKDATRMQWQRRSSEVVGAAARKQQGHSDDDKAKRFSVAASRTQ